MNDLGAAYKLREICRWIDSSGDGITVKDVRKRLEQCILEWAKVYIEKNPGKDPAANDSSLLPESTIADRFRVLNRERQKEAEEKLKEDEKMRKKIEALKKRKKK